MIGRMSTAQIQSSALASITEAQAAVTRLQTQLGTGKRLLTPADDPGASAELLRLKSALSETETLQKNLDFAETSITTEETSLSSSMSILQRVRELFILGSTDTLGGDERNAIATELTQLREQLLSIANTQNADGNYVFAGSSVTQPAFDSDGVFRGDENRLNVNISKGVTLPVRSIGSDIFGDAASESDVFRVITEFIDTFLGSAQHSVTSNFGIQTEPLSLSASELTVRLGGGNVLPVPEVTDPGYERGGSYSRALLNEIKQVHPDIDGLVAATTMELGSFSDIRSTSESDSYGLTINGVEIISSTNLKDDDITAEEVQLALSAKAGELAVAGIVVSGNTEDGITLTAADGRNIQVDEDHISSNGFISGNAFQNTALTNDDSTRSSIQYAQITLTADVTLNLGGAKETNAGFADNQSSFTALDKIDDFMERVSVARSEAGTKLNRIDAQRGIHESTSLHVTKIISKIEDVDFAKAVSELNLHMTALQAAQQTFVKTQNLSIFNYL